MPNLSQLEALQIRQACQRIREIAHDIEQAAYINGKTQRFERLVNLTMMHKAAAIEIQTLIGDDPREIYEDDKVYSFPVAVGDVRAGAVR